MKRTSSSRRRPAVHITLGRAARLHRLVMFLAASPRSRDEVLAELRIGLRTFYRELELLKRCGVRIQQKHKAYTLLATAEQAEGRLPFPDPQLSFAEMRASVINAPTPGTKRPKARGGRAARPKVKEDKAE